MLPLLDRYGPPLLRAGFAAALVVILVGALYPTGRDPSGHGDKVVHFAAFYGLTLLGAAAYPRARDIAWLVAVLSGYGALIEILQPLPPFGRDRDILDWLADNAGIALALVPFAVAQWRRRQAPSSQ